MNFSDRIFVQNSERRLRQDIEALKEAVTAPDPNAGAVIALQQRVNQLELLVNALAKIVELKGLATPVELEVLVQQIDLRDGSEDGYKAKDAWYQAPRCEHCNHFVNPKREACIYCGRSLSEQGAAGGPYRGGPAGSANEAGGARTARCAKCESEVAQSDTFFTDRGELWCSACFRE